MIMYLLVLTKCCHNMNWMIGCHYMNACSLFTLADNVVLNN